MRFTLLTILLLFAGSGWATDCNADCESHFDKWYQGPDLTRCQAEREIACKTKLTTCDIWRYNPQTTTFYYAAIEGINLSNRKTGWPMTANDCHAAADLGSTAASAAGGAKFLYQVWQTGLKASEILSEATVVSAAVSEMVKSFVHCACTHAKYVKVEEEAAEEGNDKFFVSMFNDKWTLWRGANNVQNRKALLDKAISEVGGTYKKRIRGSFSSHKRTLTEAICHENTYWAIDTGEASQHKAFTEAKSKGWKQCLFRTRNFPQGEPKVSDRFFCSVARKDGAWWMKTGSIAEKEEVIAEAKAKLGGKYDTIRTGRFSSGRSTSTFASCSKKPEVSGDLLIQDSVIFLNSGFGYRSIDRALEIVKRKYSGQSCFFDTNDVDFGPIP